MDQSSKLTFTNVNPGSTPPASDNLVLAIRTDARHALSALQRNIVSHWQRQKVQAAYRETAEAVTIPANPESVAKQILHQAYQTWGERVLGAFGRNLDYDQYGITDPAKQKLDIHFYNASALAQDAVTRGLTFVQERFGKDKPALLVTLDDMIEPRHGQNWSEIAFSRLFTPDGKQQLDFVARPGRPPLPEQLEGVRQIVGAMAQQSGGNVPIILVEDNVRHAKMLNWVVGNMDKAGIFEKGTPAAIATCFSMANERERAAIQYKGAQIPVVASVDYGSAKVDVFTPRDLLFDGLVVQLNQERNGRLPAVFLDESSLTSRFKIRPDKTAEFLRDIRHANAVFCYTVEKLVGSDLPLKWFACAEPIAQVTGANPDRPMHGLMQSRRTNALNTIGEGGGADA